MKKILLSCGIVLIGIAVWFFYPAKKTNEKVSESTEEHSQAEAKIIKLTSEQITAMGIPIAEAQPAQLSMTLSTRGKIILHPDRLAHVYPKISGVAREAFKNIGDEVHQGEKLAIMESREMADVKANYLAAIEREKLTRALLNREKNLHAKKISAEQDYLNALSNFEEARIHLQQAKQQLHAYGLTEKDLQEISTLPNPDLRSFAIRAPIDGTIINRHLTKGEYIDSTAMIYEIADLSHVWVEIGIFPKDLSRVKVGQMVQVTLPVEGATVQAKLIYVSPIIQEETITSTAVAVLCNTDRNWRPGTFVAVSIDTDKVSVPVAIAREAIQDIEGASYVFVQVPEGFEKRNVRTGKGDIAYVEVLTGVQAGEKLAAAKTFLLKAEMGKDEVEDDD